MTPQLCTHPFTCTMLIALAGSAWCALATVARPAEPQNGGEVRFFSLVGDFSYAHNSGDGTWSYRLDDSAKSPPAFPSLSSVQRDANALWGSDFPSPPMMWSEATGYWGIGKNLTGKELFSSKNGTKWAPGEVLLHPKGGGSPSGLVIAWTAPASMTIDVKYTFGLAASGSNGIGFNVARRTSGTDAEVVALDNIGSTVTNDLKGLVVAQGDQLIFRFDTCGDATGDIVRADITIQGASLAAAQATAPQPSGGVITAGSHFTLSVSAAGTKSIQWRKDGKVIPGATGGSYRISDTQPSDAGVYSVVIDAVARGVATLTVTPKAILPERFRSPTPRCVLAPTLAEQEEELKTNPLMLRFAASRKKLAADPYRPAYHFVSPESQLNDPNGLCFWRGRWHLFYQGYPPDEFPDPHDIPKRRQHWGHAVSDDLVHWRDLPYAIYPGVERMCFSGSTVVEDQQVVAFYPGIGAGQMVAVSKDPLLLNWEKLGGKPVHGSPSGDSCLWKEGDAYFGLIGARTLVRSPDLVHWQVRTSAFLGGGPWPIDDGSCPTFQPIGDKHILLLFSHSKGGQYLLGDYDRKLSQFTPYEHGRFNHGTVSPGGVHAPSAAADGKGGVINILNINDAKPSPDWDQIMSLAQRLTLGPDKRLRIEPVEAVAALRAGHQHVGETILKANQEVVLESIKGNAIELDAEIDPQESRWVQLNVLRSPHAEEQTSITFYNYDRKMSIWYHTPGVVCLDGSHSSTLPDVWLRPPERAVLERGAGPLKLRVFVDCSVVEVFINGKLYLAMRVYPGRPDSVGVSVRAQGQDAVLKRLDAWQMRSIWPKPE